MKKLFITLLLFLPLPALAATPTIVGTPVTASGAGVSSVTKSITIPSGDSNICLIVIAISDGGNNTAFSGTGGSITFNGTPMSQIVSVVGNEENGGIMYYLASPTVTTANIVATLETSVGTRNVAFIGFVLQNCAQSSPVDATGATVFGTGTSAAPAVTTTVANDLVIGWVAPYSTASSLLTSQTFVTNTPFAPAGGYGQFGAAIITTGTVTTNTFSFTWTNSNHYDSFATSIRYLAPANAPTYPTEICLGVYCFFQ